MAEVENDYRAYVDTDLNNSIGEVLMEHTLEWHSPISTEQGIEEILSYLTDAKAVSDSDVDYNSSPLDLSGEPDPVQVDTRRMLAGRDPIHNKDLVLVNQQVLWILENGSLEVRIANPRLYIELLAVYLSKVDHGLLSAITVDSKSPMNLNGRAIITVAKALTRMFDMVAMQVGLYKTSNNLQLDSSKYYDFWRVIKSTLGGDFIRGLIESPIRALEASDSSLILLEEGHDSSILSAIEAALGVLEESKTGVNEFVKWPSPRQ